MGGKLLVFEDFADKVGDTFAVLGLGETALELTLKQAELLPAQPGACIPRPPFSLIFDGPADVLLPQRAYDLETAGLGQVEVFIVPVGRTTDAISYQAIFS